MGVGLETEKEVGGVIVGVTVGVFLQARMGSVRFPGKVMAPLGGSTVIEQCMTRLDRIPADIRVVVTELGSLDPLSEVARRHKWECFAGHPTDVMKRFIDAGVYYGVDVVVRATGDNPLVDPKLSEWLLATHLKSGAVASRLSGCTPGTVVEVVNLDALMRRYPDSTTRDREHVMPAIWWSMDPVNVLWGHPTYDEPVTVDTPSDLERIRRYVSE